MSYFDHYKARLNANGLSDIERFKLVTTEFLLENIKNSPSYSQVILGNQPSPVYIDAQIVDDSETKEEKILIALFDTPISLGNVITWNNSKWLIVHFDEIGEIYKRAKIRKCLSTLKWINADGFIKEVDFTYAAAPAMSIGIQDGQILSLPNERRQLLVQSDEPVSYWYLDASGNPVYVEYSDGNNSLDARYITKSQRFIFDQRAWKCNAYDKLTDGLITLTLEEGLIDPAKDNVEERIADYVGNAAQYSILIMDGDTIAVNTGSTAQLTVEVKNNGNLVNKEVIFTSSDETKATVSSTGLVTGVADGTVTITAKLAIAPEIFDTISVQTATVVQNNYTLSVAETPSVIKDQSPPKTFNAVVKNNGTVVTGRQIQWSVFADDEVSSTTKAAITSFNDTQCMLRGDAIGYVKLKMTLVDPDPRNNVPTFIRIQIKSLV